jgi:hypothetical protein
MAVSGKYSRTLIDYGDEKTIFRANVAVLTAANFDAQATLRAALGTAIAGICIGNLNQVDYGNVDFQTNLAPDDPLAQRENKWLVQYVDDTTQQLYRCELGTADLTALDPNDRAHAHIGDADVVDAFVDAFEAYVLSPDGNSVTIKEITFVGRNT